VQPIDVPVMNIDLKHRNLTESQSLSQLIRGYTKGEQKGE